MNDKVKLQEQALKALVILNKKGVESLLIKYKYPVSVLSSSNDLVTFLTVGMSRNETFAANVLALLNVAKQYPYHSADDTSGSSWTDIITAALQGIGMITTAWMTTAQEKLAASKYTTDNKISPLAITGIIVVAVAAIAIGTVYVIKYIKAKKTK